jgi:hypothetical protein
MVWSPVSLDPADGFTDSTVAPLSYTNVLLSVVMSTISSVANSNTTLPVASAAGVIHDTIDDEICFMTERSTTCEPN